MRWSRAVRLAAAAALVLTSVSPGYVRFLGQGLPDARAWFAMVVDRPGPGFSEFLSRVRMKTQPGDSIALVVPTRDWDKGYSYAYFRASYVLAGRRVVPVVDDHDRVQPGRLRDTRWVAAWGARFVSEEFVTIWSGSGGSLARRR